MLLLGAAGASHAAPIACNALLNTTIEGATITTAQLNPAGGGLPDHCEVVGVINPRTGVDGQPYAIKLHLRMPTAWNERFYFQAAEELTAPRHGERNPASYAVVATDGATTTQSTPPLAGSFQFGYDLRRAATALTRTCR